MAKEEKKEPTIYDIHADRHRYAKKHVDTMHHYWRKSFHDSIEKHLVKDGNVDFSLLDDDEVQKKLYQTVLDNFYDLAVKPTGVKAKNDFEKHRLITAYGGIDPEQLKESLGQYGGRLNYETVEGILGEGVGQIRQQAYSNAAEHIGYEHVDDIAKKFNIEDKVRGKLDLRQARSIMNAAAESGGQLTDEILRRILGRKFKKKK